MENLKSLLTSATVEELLAALQSRTDVKLIKRLGALELSPFPPEEPGHLVILDTEATGKDASKDELVELGMLKVLYCKRSWRLCAVVDEFNQLRDPGIPMPPEASKVNHITDDMLVGQSIDFEAVARFIEDADWVIAHNADFDRPLVERYVPEFFNKAWACSMRTVDWAAVGINGAKLEYIAFMLGFFYEGHRATIDCAALLQVLASMVVGESGPSTPFEMLMQGAREETTRIYAFGAAFDKKDLLKARGYRWHAGETAPEKSWHTTVTGEQARNEEFTWLRENIYGRRGFSPGVVRIDAFSRHSSRLPEVTREYL